MNKQANTKTIERAVVTMKAVKKLKDVGVVEGVRFVAARFPRLNRQEFLAVAAKARVNQHTASRQFNEVRNGHVPAPRLNVRLH